MQQDRPSGTTRTEVHDLHVQRRADVREGLGDSWSGAPHISALHRMASLSKELSLNSIVIISAAVVGSYARRQPTKNLRQSYLGRFKVFRKAAQFRSFEYCLVRRSTRGHESSEQGRVKRWYS